MGLQAAPPTHSDGEPGEAKIRCYSGLAGASTWRERTEESMWKFKEELHSCAEETRTRPSRCSFSLKTANSGVESKFCGLLICLISFRTGHVLY